MANILLSVGLVSSLSISSTKSFFVIGSVGYPDNRRGSYLGKPGELIIDRTNRLLNRFLKRSTDAHDFTDALHATTQEAADTTELLQVPAGNLDNNIVQTRLEAGRRDSGNGVPDFVQGNVKTKFSGDKRKWVSGGFRGKSRRSR
jgi:hypothetical protein